MTRSVAEVRASALACPPTTKELFIIISMHIAHGEQGVNPALVRWFDGVMYKL